MSVSHGDFVGSISRVSDCHEQMPRRSAHSGPVDSIQDLLLRMSSGDREAAAEFLERYGSRIRRRIRGKLAPRMRRIFDSLDIMSTLGRRMDYYVQSGRLNVTDEGHLWSLVMRMADHAVIDKSRLCQRLQAVEGGNSDFARLAAERLRQVQAHSPPGTSTEIDDCLRALPDVMDRQILSFWLAGNAHAEIAEKVDLSAVTVRKRWESIKVRLRERMAPA